MPDLVSLPPEILHKILSYLSPQDLLRLTPLHSKLHTAGFHGSLWRYLYPVAWARGQLNPPSQTFSEVRMHNKVCIFDASAPVRVMMMPLESSSVWNAAPLNMTVYMLL